MILFPVFSKDLDENSHLSSQKLFKMNWENDLFFFSDREYTNGVKIEYGEYRFIHSPTSWILSGFSFLSNTN
jgi:hypothetical protein